MQFLQQQKKRKLGTKDSDRRKDHLNEIIDGLFLGDYKAARSDKIITDNKITHILTVGTGIEPCFSDRITYKFISGSDSENAYMQ